MPLCMSLLFLRVARVFSSTARPLPQVSNSMKLGGIFLQVSHSHVSCVPMCRLHPPSSYMLLSVGFLLVSSCRQNSPVTSLLFLSVGAILAPQVSFPMLLAHCLFLHEPRLSQALHDELHQIIMKAPHHHHRWSTDVSSPCLQFSGRQGPAGIPLVLAAVMPARVSAFSRLQENHRP